MILEQLLEMAETDEGLAELETMISESNANASLANLEFLFGDDVDIVLENMLNTDEALEAVAMICLREEEELNEFIVKRVDSKGNISRHKDRKTRQRLATQTTGLSKSRRRQIARKAAKTKRANPSATVRAVRKQKRAKRRRKMMGL